MKFGIFKKSSGWFFVPVLLLLLAGCCRILPRKEGPYRVVTQIQIAYQNGSLVAQRQFFREDKIQTILCYLRIIDPYGTPKEAPEQTPGSDFYITVWYSDGTKQVYHQHSDRYMRLNGGPWKRIDPQKAIDLSHLLGMMSSDPVPGDEEPPPPLIRPDI